jgi:hypothetical protein
MKQDTQSCVLQWNQMLSAPQAVIELEEVRGRPDEEKSFKARMEGWRSHCKNDAWRQWYVAKRGWIQKDLVNLQQHTVSLRRYATRLEENKRRLEEDLINARRALSMHEGYQQQQFGQQRLQELHESAQTRATGARVSTERKVATLQALSDAEALRISELEALVEGAQRNAEREKDAANKARSDHLRMKAQRLSLEQARRTQTCQIIEATPNFLRVALRAGARLRIAHDPRGGVGQKPSSPVRIDLEVETSTPNPKRNSLLACMWRACVAQIRGLADARETTPTGKPNDAVAIVPYGQLPRFLARFGMGCIQVTDQLQVLDDLPKKVAGVLNTDVTVASAQNSTSSSTTSSLALVIAVKLLISHTHDLDERTGRVVTVDPEHDPAAYEGTRWVLHVDADPLRFPQENGSWTNPRLHMISRQASSTDFDVQAAAALEAARLPAAFAEAVPAMVNVARETSRIIASRT